MSGRVIGALSFSGFRAKNDEFETKLRVLIARPGFRTFWMSFSICGAGTEELVLDVGDLGHRARHSCPLS